MALDLGSPDSILSAWFPETTPGGPTWHKTRVWHLTGIRSRPAKQDRLVVESQLPERIPTDLRDELHLEVPDASGIAYREFLGAIQGIAAYMP